MRTDTIFYKLFLTFPNLLFEILQIPAQEGYQFSSREIKELARRFDGIFMPPENESEKPIYFVEVQFQDKQDFWWRFITEIFVYLGQYQPQNDWFAIALFASRKFDPGLPSAYDNLIITKKIQIFYLDELEFKTSASISLDVISLIVGDDNFAIKTAPILIKETKQTVSNVVNQTKILELIETILIYKLNNITREEIEAMFTLDELKETRYFKDVAADFKRQGEIEGEIKGEIKGKIKGKIEGKIEGKLETVPFLIQLGISVEEIATRLNLPLEAVKKAAEN